MATSRRARRVQRSRKTRGGRRSRRNTRKRSKRMRMRGGSAVTPSAISARWSAVDPEVQPRGFSRIGEYDVQKHHAQGSIGPVRITITPIPPIECRIKNGPVAWDIVAIVGKMEYPPTGKLSFAKWNQTRYIIKSSGEGGGETRIVRAGAEAPREGCGAGHAEQITVCGLYSGPSSDSIHSHTTLKPATDQHFTTDDTAELMSQHIEAIKSTPIDWKEHPRVLMGDLSTPSERVELPDQRQA
jgi:hypothetical protein